MTDSQPSRARLALQAAIAVGIVGCSIYGVSMLFDSAPTAKRRSRPPRRALLVEVHEARAVSYPLTLRASGLVTPSRRVDVVSQVRGIANRVHKDFVPGRIVPRGTVLVGVDPRDYALAVDRAKSEVAKAKATLTLEQGSQELAALEAKYLQDLVDEDHRGLVLRKPQLNTAEATLAGAAADLQQAELSLSRTKIGAPFDALVLSRDVAVGSRVNDQGTLATIVGVDEWWVRVEVPVSFLSQLEEGKSAVISFPNAWGERQREGTILERAASVEERGRLASILVAVKDPLARRAKDSPALLLNTWVDVALTGRTIENAVVLKPGWVNGGNRIWAMNDKDELVSREIVVVYQDDQEVVAISGIEQGLRIVTSPLASPVSGMKLRVRSKDAPAVGRPTGRGTKGKKDES